MHDRSSKDSLNASPVNKHHENDIRYCLQFSRWILKSIGMWSLIDVGSTKREKIISVFLRILLFSSMCLSVIIPSYHTFFMEKNLNAKIKLLGPISFFLTSCFKYSYLGIKSSALTQCIQHIELDWKMVGQSTHRMIMLRNSAVGRRLPTICAVILYSGGISYHTVMPYLYKAVIGNVTVRQLVMPGFELFFDTQTSPTYDILVIYQAICGFVMYNTTLAGCSLAAIFVMHACGQMEIQMARLENVVKQELEDHHGEDILAVIFRDHVRVLRFSESAEKVIREICFFELVGSTLAIVFLEYYCIVEWNASDVVAIITYFMLLVFFTFQILIFCYIGELLVDKGGKIGNASYGIEWYKLPVKKARCLILLIAIAKSPPKLTAGKMFTLSLHTFAHILRTTFGYLNLIRKVIE